ncbi:RHS repeat-associated core domain-containing protein [Pseudomonas sp. WJP1]|uniref:RHS repeat-associated core domain-containing protein n=1 Tax=Pseudomonas sp. WJP1 TaxID=2986947 RepID=UPI00234965E9|nr:RHS repeat-associated core domain-containing protein [Pseudomonas sp. WJP1]WCM52322.1 RHS repeat-associated core domain-containing protein [Pseudomonas sp. WJP1]
MPMSPRETLLCRYRYDPLDRATDWAPDQQASIQRFYCKSRLATEIQGAAKYSFLQHDEQVLAQQRQVGDKVDTTLLATDQQHSVLNALAATQPHPLAYSPYGHRPLGDGLLSLLGFNGERPDPVTGHYHLGNGYRQFNPRLMRFNSPDSWSPFREGGLNAYMYCGADPINRRDPTGHSAFHISRKVLIGGFYTSAALTFAGVGVAIAGMAVRRNDEDSGNKMLIGGAIAAGIGLAGAGMVVLRARFYRQPRSSFSRGNSSISSRPDNPPPYPGNDRAAASTFNNSRRSSTPPPSYESFELTQRSPTSPLDHSSITSTTPTEPPPSYYPPAQTPIGQRAEQLLRTPGKLMNKKTNIRRTM